MLWELRVRMPRGVDDRYIETDTDDEAEARRVADAYIDSLASPVIRFVYLRRFVIASSATYPRPRVEGGPVTDPLVKKPSLKNIAEQAGRIGA